LRATDGATIEGTSLKRGPRGAWDYSATSCTNRVLMNMS
jgi:hypothetical protein